MRIRTIFILTIAILFSVHLKTFAGDNKSEILFYDLKKIELKNNIVYGKGIKSLKSDSIEGEIADPNLKLPGRALLRSAILPGWGELYAGSEIKAMIFLGLEIASWTTYGIYENKGNKQTDEFENFADKHWNEKEYANYIYEQVGRIIEIFNPDGSINYDSLNYAEDEYIGFSHALPAPGKNNQQRYEMIGKYDQFIYGWDDIVKPDTIVTKENLDKINSANRQSYLTQRKQANDYYRIAGYGITAVMINHLLSAFDAALTVKLNNDKYLRSSVRLENKRYGNEIVTMAVINFKW
jgi:hypothetical protein